MKASQKTKAVSCFLILTLCLFLFPVAASALEIVIDVSPNVINIQSESTVVTVHTDIAFGDVDVYTVFLNGVSISSWKADNRGNFVAKFASEAVKEIVSVGSNTLKLVGDTSYGEAFSGEQEIMVINVIPAGQGG